MMSIRFGSRLMACVIGVAVALPVVSLVGCGGGGSSAAAAPAPAPTPAPPVLPPTYVSTGRAVAGDVFVQLFEWRWADVARECEEFLGPKGYSAVQISPPTEHALVASTSTGVSYPWWQRYQTVSYALTRSRSGTAAEFADMVSRCRTAGVGIYADMVVNHMTAGAGTGSAGSPYTKTNYPAVPFASEDFHAACAVTNYADARNVQDCELVGLADLRTESNSVRSRIANALVAVHATGVAGFRIDAAKHMPPADIDAILAQVNAAALAAGRTRPYVFLEVINNTGEAVTAQDYYGVGYSSGGAADITDFQYGYRISDAFYRRNGASPASLQTSLNALPSDKAVVFVDNHDNQRGNNIHYADGAAYELAVLFALAHPVGHVSLISSFGFDRSSAAGRDQGPPSDNAGVTQSTFDSTGSTCSVTLGAIQSGRWICEHRRPAVAAMVAFRRVTAGSALSAWTRLGNSDDQIAFARQGRGFFAVNRGAVASGSVLVSTTLPAGQYCNVVRDVFTPAPAGGRAACSGSAVLVDANGQATINVPSASAVALHVGAALN